MTFHILFFSISVNKRSYSKDEIQHEMEIQRISEEIQDRKCTLHHLI